MIVIFITVLILIRLVIILSSKKCPYCKHRVFSRPFDIRFMKSINGRLKISSYECNKCKRIFESEHSTF